MTTSETTALELDGQAPDTAAVVDDATTVDQADDNTADPEPDREAAKFRRQLRETETDRDNLRSRLETLQRREVERLAALDFRIEKPSAIWAAGLEISQLVDEAGDLDPALIRIATKEAIDKLGLSVRGMKSDPSQGARGGAPTGANPWARLLAPKN